MVVSEGVRTRVLRKLTALSQGQLIVLADTNQADINRYGTDWEVAPSP